MKNFPIALLIASLSFVGGYYTGATKSKTQISSKTPTVSSTPANTKQTTMEAMSKEFINRFEQAQINRDVEAVLKLISPPESPQEKDKYISIMGLDLPNPSPRLYNTSGLGYKLESFSVKSLQVISNFSAIAEVEEVRSLYDNTTGKWTRDKPRVLIFELDKNGLYNPLIKAYYQKGQQKDKYSGFY